MDELEKYILDRHDVYCNQKYGKINNFEVPYSFHLKSVQNIANYYIKDVFSKEELNKYVDEYDIVNYYTVINNVCLFHDAIEDTRISPSELESVVSSFKGHKVGEKIAKLCYLLTENKGYTRKERQNDNYYKEISKNKIASFVKLCDRLANIYFSKLTNLSKLKMYKKEEYILDYFGEEFDILKNEIKNQLS